MKVERGLDLYTTKFNHSNTSHEITYEIKKYKILQFLLMYIIYVIQQELYLKLIYRKY